MPATSSNARQTSAYYDQLTDGLLHANVNHLSYVATANHLNDLGLLSPTGKLWTIEILQQTFKKLRHPDQWPSFLHHHLMVLVYRNILTAAQVQPLLQSRRIKVA